MYHVYANKVKFHYTRNRALRFRTVHDQQLPLSSYCRMCW